jgi:hypothetical protein
MTESGDDTPSTSHSRRALELPATQTAKTVTKFVREGAGPLDGAAAYAEDRLHKFDGDVERAIRRIVNETTATTGATGFPTGLGGFVTLPAAIAANLAGSMLLNARMVGAVADLRGWSLDADSAQTAILLLAAGGSLNEALTTAGARVLIVSRWGALSPAGTDVGSSAAERLTRHIEQSSELARVSDAAGVQCPIR